MMQSTESSVQSIVASFTSGLDVFRRLRTCRQRRQPAPSKAGSKQSRRGTKEKRGQSDGEELRLSQSLRRGSADVRTTYEAHAKRGGARYAAGDATAQASLAQTLLKLNVGLVSIITSFLSSGKHDMPIDYKSLTSLSDISRMEAVDALGQLYNRLSEQDLSHQPRPSPARQTGQAQRRKSPDRRAKQESRKTERSPSLPPGLAKVTVSSSQTQLAFVRPANKRKDSAISTSSAKSKGSRSPSSSSSKRSTEGLTPPTPPPGYEALPDVFPRLQGPQSLAALPQCCENPIQQQQPLRQQPSDHAVSRRQDKATPSYYSFASDSTKLGEIPMRKWTVPFDYAEMERRNREALANGWQPGTAAQGPNKGRSKLRKWFGKGNAQAS